MLDRSARTSSALEAAAWTTNAETFRREAAAARSSVKPSYKGAPAANAGNGGIRLIEAPPTVLLDLGS